MRNKNLRKREATDQRIGEMWDTVSEEFGSKSTEFCLQMTADRASVTYERMVDALTRRNNVVVNTTEGTSDA
jgi:hypothetical protein